MDEAAKFCSACGAGAPSAQQSQNLPPPPQSQPGAQQSEYKPPPTSAGLQPNVAGLLCYVVGLITGIVFLALEPYNKDRFVRFHAFQSIFFHIAWIVLWIVESIVSYSLPWMFHVAGLFYMVLMLGGLLVWLFLMYKAYNNETFKLPVIGDMAMKQAG